MDRKSPLVEAQMLIRKPVSDVFNAFIDPEITKNFWFTKSSGKLENGKTITWEWEMYNVSTPVIVKQIIQDKKISIDWGEPKTSVDFNFEDMGNGNTYVVIQNYGFDKTGDELLKEINDSTGGFTTVLDGLKAFMEHNINLHLIADKFPKGVV
jgi:uncharacterized protein YndB with AHSA1/START domain